MTPQAHDPRTCRAIVIGGVALNVGSGGLHSEDRPALYRSDADHEVFETDVASFYPSMMARFEIFPRSLGSAGLEQFKEVLAERIEIKERVLEATEPEEAAHYKAQSNGLKIVLNSTFGQFGNPFSTLYDPTAFLAVTLTGQLMLIDLLERLDSAGAEILSVNTDGLYFQTRRDSDAWHKVLSAWESDTGMALETTPLDALVIEATNNYATLSATGVKRRGTLSGDLSWRNVPNSLIVADAVLAALLNNMPPESTIYSCVDPAKFVNITRRNSTTDGYLINDTTGEETPLPRLIRWYKAVGSPYRIEHRSTDAAGKIRKTTPPGGNRHPTVDGSAGTRSNTRRHRHFVVHRRGQGRGSWPTATLITSIPSGCAGIAGGLGPPRPRPRPQPALGGKKSPKGSKKDHPSYFWDWHPLPHFRDLHRPPVRHPRPGHRPDPDKFRKWIEAPLWDPRDLDDCMVSYHRCDSPEAVRAGQAKGKLIFQFEVGADHPLARVGKAALRQALGIEIFYGHGDPSILGGAPGRPRC